MNKRTVAAWIKKLEAHRAKVAKVRDELREAMYEMEAMRDTCVEAYENIDAAIDRLSELA